MPRAKSTRQQEKNALVREQLLQAAMRVVGKAGYAKAQIAKIAELAKVSTGTFYLHFSSKQALYDVLLPWANDDLTQFTARRGTVINCYMQHEERTMRSFFEYVAVNQPFITVMLEAEVAAPLAWTRYCEIREAAYLKELEAAWQRGEFPDYRMTDMPQICNMLLALRRNVVVRYCDRRNHVADAKDDALETYLTFVFGALHRTNWQAILEQWRPAETSHPRALESAASK